jgi:hypothetical protein
MTDRQIAAIGMKRSDDPVCAMESFNAVIEAVKQFVANHPEMILGEGEFTVMFGDRTRIVAQVPA